MPIIPRVGRKAFRIRFLLAVVYIVLSLGAVTMVYPFLLMLATSITSSTDTNEFRVVPRYLHDETALFAKHVDEKYSGEIELVNAMYHTDWRKLDRAIPPSDLDEQGTLVKEWRAFVKTLPEDYKATVFRGYGQHPNMLARLYRAYLRDRFKGDIRALNRLYTEENTTFDTVLPPMERHSKRNWVPDSSPKMREFQEWKKTLPEEYKPVFSVEAIYNKYLLEDAPDFRDPASRSLAEKGGLALEASIPNEPVPARYWEAFVRKKLPFRYIRLDETAVDPYRSFLARKYGTVDKLNETHGSSWKSFAEVRLPGRIPSGGPINIDWSEYVSGPMPIRSVRVDTPENLFRAHLATAGANPSAGVTAGSAVPTQPPYWAADALHVRENAAALRKHYLGRNYAVVIDYILLHGRSLVVTAVFCALVIITTLIVNPLCAYALSRFQLPYAYKILLFVLATMAFPAEVAMIPNFLLLKQLGFLNTYWALILPGMASGFSIFLLKGFFDSLPKELYEAGTIDGASETRMFFKLTIPLSKPIFAVIALHAFTAAYGAFMFALLVCQDPRMWTLMVWLYELQITNPQYIMMAGLAVAALPTLLVFVFAQNVIMRGIILPSEK